MRVPADPVRPPPRADALKDEDIRVDSKPSSFFVPPTTTPPPPPRYALPTTCFCPWMDFFPPPARDMRDLFCHWCPFQPATPAPFRKSAMSGAAFPSARLVSDLASPPHLSMCISLCFSDERVSPFTSASSIPDGSALSLLLAFGPEHSEKTPPPTSRKPLFPFSRMKPGGSPPCSLHSPVVPRLWDVFQRLFPFLGLIRRSLPSGVNAVTPRNPAGFMFS